MKKILIYLRLMRFHQPIGILLLWAPTAWALWIANQGAPRLRLVLYFMFGTLCMRSAGCVINDIADRHVDKHVARTRSRPLTAGDINLLEALTLLFGLLLMAAWIVLQLPPLCFIESLLALLIAGIYPFCKRFVQVPQLILGLAFSMSIPMAYAASGVAANGIMGVLFLLNTLWILMYDTFYAMVDRDDDLRIGVKSTAILFAPYDRLFTGCLQVIIQVLWLVIAWQLHLSGLFYIAWALGSGLMIYQQQLLALETSQAYFRAFAYSGVYGMVMWMGVW